MVVAFPPGGLADNTARPVAAAMERLLKQPVVVANKPGAAGAVGNQVTATSKPDDIFVTRPISGVLLAVGAVLVLLALRPLITRTLDWRSRLPAEEA